MANACLILADGFNEMEAVAIVFVLRRAGIETTLLGFRGLQVRGGTGVLVGADQLFHDARDRIWDAVILPGGHESSQELLRDESVRELLTTQYSAGRICAAICAGPIVFDALGLLEGRRATSHPAFQPTLKPGEYLEDAVVVDGHVITSRSPGSTMEFAFTVVEQLGHEAEADVHRKKMMVPRPPTHPAV